MDSFHPYKTIWKKDMGFFLETDNEECGGFGEYFYDQERWSWSECLKATNTPLTSNFIYWSKLFEKTIYASS